ncbi:MAG: glycosyltransferase [Holdemanella porci]
MDEQLITVFTPTYNQCIYSVNNVYESLKRQTSKSFEWIIVDDGSA